MFNYPVALDLKTDDLEKEILPNLLLVIPEVPLVKCEDEEVGVERHINESEIRRMGNSQDGAILQETIYEIKEGIIKEDLMDLSRLVEAQYLVQLKMMGISPDSLPPDLYQAVEVPFTLLDLFPGDTQIHYRLFTKRGLSRYDK